MAYKRSDKLVTSPQHLIFNAPYNRIQSHGLSMINNTAMILLFKVKTNSVQHYTVRPCVGQVQPFTTLRIIISLNYFEFKPEIPYRHRFIVESIYVPVGCLSSSDRDHPKRVFQRTPRSEICLVRVPVRLEATPVSPSQMIPSWSEKNTGNVQKTSDLLPKTMEEQEKKPQLKTETVLEEQTDQQLEKPNPEPQKSDQKPYIWLITILIILGLLVGGIYSIQDKF